MLKDAIKGLIKSVAANPLDITRRAALADAYEEASKDNAAKVQRDNMKILENTYFAFTSRANHLQIIHKYKGKAVISWIKGRAILGRALLHHDIINILQGCSWVEPLTIKWINLQMFTEDQIKLLKTINNIHRLL